MSTELNTTVTETKAKKSRKPSVFSSAKDFVIAHLDAVKKGWSLNQFADSCGMKPLSLRSRITLMKKKGVMLPDLAKEASSGRKGRMPIDVPSLNELIFGAPAK